MIIDPGLYFSRAYVSGGYEQDLVRYLVTTIQPGMVCVDVGANVGYFTLLMASLVGTSGRVVAFEPTASTCRVLRDNVRLNGFRHVNVEELALSNYDGVLPFREGPAGFDVYNTAGTITHPSAAHIAFASSAVNCTTLDRYLNRIGIERINLIKIDVEGSELSVLEGMEDMLRRNPQLRLIIEFADQTTRGFGYRARDIGAWLLERGLRLSMISAHGELAPVSLDRIWDGQMVVATRNFYPPSLDWGAAC